MGGHSESEADLPFGRLLDPTSVEAARLANSCRRAGAQLGSVEALLAQLAIANDLALLTTDRHFENAAEVVPLRVWQSKSRREAMDAVGVSRPEIDRDRRCSATASGRRLRTPIPASSHIAA